MSVGAVLLEVRNLHVSFRGARGRVEAVRGVSYDIREGEVLGIVGESGSGKSAQAYSVMGLLRGTGRVTDGNVYFRGEDILKYERYQWEALRGNAIGMIFQDPVACLDPMMPVYRQLREAAMCHSEISRRAADELCMQMLNMVGVDDTKRVLRQFPSGLSGGMCQRIMIAMALLQEPQILIADEPTTSLDVMMQAQIILMLKQLCRERNMAVMFITHDMGLVAEICDTVCVMYAGRIVEKGPVLDIFDSPAHPYTAGLMRATPNLGVDEKGPMHSIDGVPVSMSGLPPGCAFHPRCRHCKDICREKEPDEIEFTHGRSAACWMVGKELR